MLQPAQVDINRKHWPFYCGVNRLCTKTISIFVFDIDVFFCSYLATFCYFVPYIIIMKRGLSSSRVNGGFNRPLVSLSCLGWLWNSITYCFQLLNKWFVFQSHRVKQRRRRLIMTKPPIKTRKRTAAFPAERKWDSLVRKALFHVAHFLMRDLMSKWVQRFSSIINCCFPFIW